MAYVKQTWETGQTITADKLNHIEDGVANSGGGLTVRFITNDSGMTYTADKTFEECMSALENDIDVKGFYGPDDGTVPTPLICDGGYRGEFGGIWFSYSTVFISDATLNAITFTLKPDDTVSFSTGDFTLTPA